jgi:protein-disulfide isomerase
VCAAVLAAAAAYGVIWRRRTGILRRTGAPRRTAAGRHADALTPAQLGQPLGSRATLVQFSSAQCATCGPTRRILADIAATADGVAHIEIDAESRLDLVRSLGVLATPTVFVLGQDGTVLLRGTGQPRRADLASAVAAVGGTSSDDSRRAPT